MQNTHDTQDAELANQAAAPTLSSPLQKGRILFVSTEASQVLCEQQDKEHLSEALVALLNLIDVDGPENNPFDVDQGYMVVFKQPEHCQFVVEQIKKFMIEVELLTGQIKEAMAYLKQDRTIHTWGSILREAQANNQSISEYVAQQYATDEQDSLPLAPGGPKMSSSSSVKQYTEANWKVFGDNIFNFFTEIKQKGCSPYLVQEMEDGALQIMATSEDIETIKGLVAAQQLAVQPSAPVLNPDNFQKEEKEEEELPNKPLTQQPVAQPSAPPSNWCLFFSPDGRLKESPQDVESNEARTSEKARRLWFDGVNAYIEQVTKEEKNVLNAHPIFKNYLNPLFRDKDHCPESKKSAAECLRDFVKTPSMDNFAKLIPFKKPLEDEASRLGKIFKDVKIGLILTSKDFYHELRTAGFKLPANEVVTEHERLGRKIF